MWVIFVLASWKPVTPFVMVGFCQQAVFNSVLGAFAITCETRLESGKELLIAQLILTTIELERSHTRA